jgi:hypothetical protein
MSGIDWLWLGVAVGFTAVCWRYRPFEDKVHHYCSVCAECITCNLRPCRNGGAHTKGEYAEIIRSNIA